MHEWSLKGFDSLAAGRYGNAGQNIYVSKKGVLQRIWQFDVNKDGYVDLLIANSHGYNEHPDTYIITDPTGDAKIQGVLTQDGQAGQVADINGDGYDDLIIATANDGHHLDVSSYVYFGGKDGITENRKIDLAARGCTCCGVGDVDGDGKKEILYLVENGSIQQNFRSGRFIRVYKQDEMGFRMDGYTDYPVDISWFTVCDIDNDGCDDLYCRTSDGKWLILWGGRDGFQMENALEVGPATDDMKRFDVLEFGGGNVRYFEFARPKVVRLKGEKHLFYADAERVTFIRMAGRLIAGRTVVNAPNIISAETGDLSGSGADDLVLLQINSISDQHALVYYGLNGYVRPIRTMEVMTPRDVLLHDFNGNGYDDIVIVQGRNAHAFTSESLVYANGPSGIEKEPHKFVTHNCVEAFVGDFTGCGEKSLVFINQQESTSYGHVPVYIFLNSADGFDPQRRIEFPGHSAGTLIPVDINDDGWPDILLLQNAEDQPHLKPPADLYWGGPKGFDLSNKVTVTAPLAWGGHCADINKDGYLDIIACCTDHIRIIYGSEDGYKDENTVIINPVEDLGEGARCGALFPAMADLNGDGWLDLVVPISLQNFSYIYWGGPDGYSNENRTKIPVELGLTVRIADLNKDGYPDLVFGSRTSFHRNVEHEGPVTIFWGGPDGYNGYNCCVLPAYESDSLTIADFNGDGWLDIFCASYFNGKERDINSYIYWNDHGNFSLTNRKRFFCHSSAAAWACDFNEDGYMDICVSHHRAYGNHNTESAIWWNGPNGFSEDNRTWLPSIGPHDMVPTDQGDIMNRGPEETYITTVGRVEKLKCVGWVGEIPKKTWVNCQIRTGGSEQELEKAAFIGSDGTENTRFACNQPIPAELIKGKFLQIKLFLGAVNSGSTPRITEIYAD